MRAHLLLPVFTSLCLLATGCGGGTPMSGGCGGGEVECAGVCVNTRTDEAHCGRCDNVCSGAQTCSASMCTGGGPIDPPPVTCTPLISLVDTSSPDRMVGDGSPASCTHAELASAVAQGGVITFDCGDADHTIVVTEALTLRIDADMLGPLQDNGRPTPTMLPAAGGVAIGLGADCPNTDQRGMPRPTGTCAAGAVEP